MNENTTYLDAKPTDEIFVILCVLEIMIQTQKSVAGIVIFVK
jgi:hypothetical protein